MTSPRPEAGVVSRCWLLLAFCQLPWISCGHNPPKPPPDTNPAANRELQEAVWDVWKNGGGGQYDLLLAESLGDPDVWVRRQAVLSIARICPPSAVALLTGRLVTERDTVVRRRIIWALGQTREMSTLGLLREVSLERDPVMRGLAAEALASLGKQAREDVLRLLGDPQPDVRLAAVLALVRHPEVEPGSDLLTALDREREERDERLRWAVFAAVSQHPDLVSKHQDLLAAGVADQNAFVSILSLDVFPGLGTRDGFEEACQVMADAKRWWVQRLAARRAVERWSRDPTFSLELRRQADEALREFPPDPPPLAFPEPYRLPDHNSLPGGTVDDGRRRFSRMLIDVRGKGQMMVELFWREAPFHVDALVELALSSAYEDVPVSRADPLLGLDVEPGKAAGSPKAGKRLPPEPHLAPIRRGTLVESPSRPGAGNFHIAGLPMPELEGKSTVIGRVVLGARLLDSIGRHDRISIFVD